MAYTHNINPVDSASISNISLEASF